VFLLNAGFPEQINGVALYNQWQACEDYNTQVYTLLEKYFGLRMTLNAQFSYVKLCVDARGKLYLSQMRSLYFVNDC
jgi:hypothetical protein